MSLPDGGARPVDHNQPTQPRLITAAQSTKVDLQAIRDGLANLSDSRLGLKALAFRTLRHLRNHRVPHVTRFPSVHKDLVWREYRVLTEEQVMMKLFLHIDSYNNAIGLPCPVSKAAIAQWPWGPRRDMDWVCTQLRRTIDTLAGIRTFRRGPRWWDTNDVIIDEVVEPPQPPVSRREPELHERILDANNRFSVLFTEWDQGSDPTFSWSGEPTSFDVPIHSKASLQEKAAYRRHEANKTRARLGYPLLPVDNDLVKSAEVRIKRSDLLVSLCVRVVRPLMLWRRDSLAAYLLHKEPTRLTIAPLTLLGAYELWAKSVLESGLGRPPPLPHGEWGDDRPRIWDVDPRMRSTAPTLMLLPRRDG